jgi:hypothetical protein
MDTDKKWNGNLTAKSAESAKRHKGKTIPKPEIFDRG